MPVTTQKTNQNFTERMKNCWIITEGIAGTENQCIAVAERLNIPFSIKRIGLKQPFHTLSPQIFKTTPQTFIKGIEWDDPQPDMIIASGRKAIPVALKFTNAFKVFIQNPKINPAYFDLVAAPAHDDIAGPNIITTTAAPNRVTPKLLDDAKTKHPLSHLPKTKIAILIGGNSKTHTMPDDFADHLAQQLKPYFQSDDYGFMVTASRRTPDTIRDQLQTLFRQDHCVYWDGTGDNPYQAYLAHADYILVTEDSTSMLSDACSTGKPVSRLALNGGSAKFNRLYAALENRCGVTLFDGKFQQYCYKALDDAQIIADEIKKRFEKQTLST